MDSINEIQKEEKTISIKIPKLKLPSLQSGVLILLIIVGALQTIQLFALDQQIASAKIDTSKTVSAPVSSSSTDSVTSSLPSMVGGC